MEDFLLHPAARRALAKLVDGDPISGLASLSPSDVGALQLALSEMVAGRISPPALLRRYMADPFAQPAGVDALALRRMEADLLSLAQGMGFEPLQLSPVSPLGACSAVATVHQNKVLSAVRGLEVTADPTNALALHYCARVKEGTLGGSAPVHMCATHRVVRGQRFHGPGLVQHFTLFAAISGGYDSGSYAFEKEALAAHGALYQSIFSTLFGKEMRVVLRKMPGYTDAEGLIERLLGHLRQTIPKSTVERHAEDGDGGYYQGMQFSILLEKEGQIIPNGDGGFVDWPQTLLANRKQRMLISAIGLDRMLSI